MLKLYRRQSDELSTLGELVLNGATLCRTLENAHHDVKIPKHTRIPAGTYPLRLRTEGGFHARYSERYPDMHEGMIEICDVPGFKYILVHCGNTHKDTDGCVLVGRDAFTAPDGSYAVSHSRDTYMNVYPQLLEYVKRHSAMIEVLDD